MLYLGFKYFCVRKIVFISLLSSFIFLHAMGQYTANHNIVIDDINGVQMKYPWAGGLNNPQFSDGDFNNDGTLDLFIFDRTGNKTLTFINHGTPNTVDYEYAPEYEAGFPKLINWALLRDYNYDGIPDIFTFTNGPLSLPGVGIQVYRGYYSLDNKIQFVNADSLLRFPYGYSMLNLYVSSVDIPAIADVNGDGDLDVLTFQITGGYVMYFENQSKELGYDSDSLIYKKFDDCWGDFYETAFQRTDLLNETCPFLEANGGQQKPGMERHAGSVETAWDNDGDGDLEFLKGDISFPNLCYLVNGGTTSDAHMVAEDTSYPAYDVPADLHIFPAPFLVDVNNDGLRDLLVAPNASGGSENFTCSWYYKNVGDAITATFSFQTDTFMTGDMIDAGEGGYPVFFDADSDGLLDMIVGNGGYFDNTNGNIYIGELAYYRNTGDAEHPMFQLVTKNYADVASLGVKNVYPAFGDLDGDGDADMLLGQDNGSLLYFKNTAASGAPANFVFFQPNYAGTDSLGSFSTPQLVDVNRDGLLDILMGEQAGILDYKQNTGTATSPDFSSVPHQLFGGVDVRQPGYLEGFSIPFLFDDNDGSGYQLLVGSKRGWIYKYTNIDSNLSGTFTLVDSFFNHISVGANSSVSGADVNGDGKVDLLVGNYRGGVTFYDSKITGINPQGPLPDDAIRIYPNPATVNFEVRIAASENAGKVQMALIDLLGEKIVEKHTDAKTPAHFDVTLLPAGIYLLEVRTEGSQVVKKIMVSH